MIVPSVTIGLSVVVSLPKTGRTGEIECIRAHNRALHSAYETGSDGCAQQRPVPFWPLRIFLPPLANGVHSAATSSLKPLVVVQTRSKRQCRHLCLTIRPSGQLTNLRVASDFCLARRRASSLCFTLRSLIKPLLHSHFWQKLLMRADCGHCCVNYNQATIKWFIACIVAPCLCCDRNSLLLPLPLDNR